MLKYKKNTSQTSKYPLVNTQQISKYSSCPTLSKNPHQGSGINDDMPCWLWSRIIEHNFSISSKWNQQTRCGC